MERGPRERKERALGERLFLKGARSLSPKSAATRRPYPPGVQGKKRRRKKLSEYGEQLRTKQKLRISYGLAERQFKRLVKGAMRKRGVTGPKVVELLERRLDNVCYRLGFAPSRLAARQLVVQGHIMVNERKTISPSYSVRVPDLISVRPESRNKKMLAVLAVEAKQASLPSWLQRGQGSFEGKVIALPTNVEFPFDVATAVEFYSK